MGEPSCSIVADSSISLPDSLIQNLPVTIVPFEIHHQGNTYRDGLDLSSGTFYQFLQDGTDMPTTSAPHPGAFVQAFEKASWGGQSVLCVTVSRKLSAAYQSALIAKEQLKTTLPEIEVRVIDSQTAGAAEGLMVLEAARQALQGANIAQLEQLLNLRIPTVQFLGCMDTLYYVWKSGRVPKVAMWMGNLLQFKPILKLSAGKIAMLERPRSRTKGIDRIVSLVQDQIKDKPARVAVIHANAPDSAAEMASLFQKRPTILELFISELTPVIGTHVGPGLIGCAFHLEETSSVTVDNL